MKIYVAVERPDALTRKPNFRFHDHAPELANPTPSSAGHIMQKASNEDQESAARAAYNQTSPAKSRAIFS